MSNPIQQAIYGLEDILNGWKYIRDTHGDLYGVGWDRAQEKAEAALSALQSLQGVELPEPVAHMNLHGVIHEAGYQWLPVEKLQGLYTADQLRTAVAAAMARGAVPQDGRPALQLADLILSMDLATEKGQRARDLARQVQEQWHESPAEDALRAIASYLGVGGYNAPYVDAAKYQAKIIEEIGRLYTAPTPEASQPEKSCGQCRHRHQDGRLGCARENCHGRIDWEPATQPTQAEAPSEREAFEHWIRQDRGDLTMFGNAPHRHYKNSAVNQSWIAWQARAALATQQAVPANPRLLEGAYRDGFGDAATFKSADTAWAYSVTAAKIEEAFATQPTQAEAAREPGKVMLDVQGLTALAGRAQENDNPLGFFRVMLQWAEQANAEIARLRAALATQQAGQGEAVGDERWWSPPDSFGTNWLTNGAALHPLTANLVVRFARALAAKLAAAEIKYGYSDGWRSADWMDECRAKLAEHVAKGDPRDVAAYCAFLWHHGESTATPPAPQQPEALAQQERDREDAPCPDGLLPDGEICPRCGGKRGPSGIDGGSWVHIRAARSSEGGSPSPSMVGREGE